MTKEDLLNKFDDIVEDDDGMWSQICTKHVKEMKINGNYLDGVGGGICGVEGCSEESDYYIDFKE